MEVNNLRFEDHKPKYVTLTMSVENLAQLTKLLGAMSYDEVSNHDRWKALHAFYEMSVDSVFNRFWDDGINDYFRE
jgi:hypothetical protein